MNVKELKTTVAYTQLRRFIEVNVEDPAKRPYALGHLVKRFIARVTDPVNGEYQVHPEACVSSLLTWDLTPEGDDFWVKVYHGRKVDNINPCPIGGGKVKARAAKQPKKKVGWW